GGSLPGDGGSGAAQRGPEGLDPSALLQDLDWMFTITKDARQSWASLQQWAKMLVLERLRIIGKGQWTRAGGVKRLEPGDNRKLRGLDLWRLKIDKGGRILFEVAVEYLGQVWLTAPAPVPAGQPLPPGLHKAIGAVRDSYRRSQDVRERRRLEVIWDPATAPSSGSTPGGPHASKAVTVAAGGVGAVRLPKRFREVVAVDHDLPPLAVQMGPSSVLAGARQAGGLAAKSASTATPKKGMAKG
ncbi:uncharacterized protein HaLaN_28316, partial [Haematococcus lacustris]